MNLKPFSNIEETMAELETNKFPNRVTLELTNHCNLSCAMCPRRFMSGPKGYMAFSIFKKVVDEMAQRNHIALVPFFRGESMLHQRCIEMLAHAKKKGLSPIQFTTNATMMSRDLAEALLDLELDFISFSVDSLDEEVYRSIRKGSELGTVMEHIDYFCNLKRRRGLTKPEIQVSMVKTKASSDGTDHFTRFWRERADRVRIYEEHSQGGNFGALAEDNKKNDRKPCLKPFTDVVVYWNGDVALCNHDWDRKNPLGNVEKNAIEEIWHNENYNRIRDAHMGKEILEKPCKKCDHWKVYYRKENLVGELHTGTSAIMEDV
jgi:radical SAM protein with 4Fe4S-binding SPASM domain